jgi:hypothetical protein
MNATQLDPRAVADTLGVTPLDLAEFLRDKAGDLLFDATKIAKNEPWYVPEDADGRIERLDTLVARAKNLMRAAVECERCYLEDNP